MLLLQTGVTLKQCMTLPLSLLKCLHSESRVCLSCNACKPANPLAWLLSEQQAHVSICQKYAALCNNIKEVKNGILSLEAQTAFQPEDRQTDSNDD